MFFIKLVSSFVPDFRFPINSKYENSSDTTSEQSQRKILYQKVRCRSSSDALVTIDSFARRHRFKPPSLTAG